jgi:hypothetical protein
MRRSILNRSHERSKNALRWRTNRSCRGVVTCVTLLWLIGCSSRPAAISIPKWSPENFTGTILERLDKSGDSQLDQRELAAAPGLAFGVRFIDKNGDGKLGRDELIERFAMYRDSRVGLMPGELRITYNGQPLADADVRLVPEFFLEDIIEPATGATHGDGVVRPSVPDQRTPLMRIGYYRVEVRSNKRPLPAKFNSQTTIGVELSPFANETVSSSTIEIALRDKT